MKSLGYFDVIIDESFFQSWCNLAFFSTRFLFKVIICSNITFKMKQNKMKQNTL